MRVRFNTLDIGNKWQKGFSIVEFLMSICESKTNSQNLLKRMMFLEFRHMLNWSRYNLDKFSIHPGLIKDCRFSIWSYGIFFVTLIDSLLSITFKEVVEALNTWNNGVDRHFHKNRFSICPLEDSFLFLIW